MVIAMSIYTANGIVVYSAFDVNGCGLTSAYNANGNLVWTSGPPSIKVMQYNVGGWYDGSGTNVPAADDEDYYELQHGMLVNNDPDILVLQEYWTQFSESGRSALTMLQSLFPYVETRDGDSTYYGHAICSKYPISNYTSRKFSGEANRYYDSCTVTVDQTPITVINTHLHPSSIEARATEVEELITFLQAYPMVICSGDLNSVSCYNTSDADYVAVIKPVVDAGFRVANCGDFGFFGTYQNVWQGSPYQRDLDNVIVSPNLTITSVSVDTTKLTDSIAHDRVDHMPFIATIQIGGST